MKTTGAGRLIAAFLIGIAATFATVLIYHAASTRFETASAARARSAAEPVHEPPAAAPVQPKPETVAPQSNTADPPPANVADPPESGAADTRASGAEAASSQRHPAPKPVQHRPKRTAHADPVAVAAAPQPSPNPYTDQAATAQPAPQSPAPDPDQPTEQAQVTQPAVPTVDSAPAPARQPHTVTIPAGTSIVVRLVQTLSSDQNVSGDNFRASLALPIVVDGFIIADKGSSVAGRVDDARKAGRIEGTSALSLELTALNTTDGQHVIIQTSQVNRAGSSATRKDAAKVGAGAVLGAIIGAIAGGGRGAGIGAGVGGAAGAGDVMITHGKQVTIPSESELTFRLAQPIVLTEKLSNH